jgi:ABC-type transporter Mla subunit MlaD
MPEVDEVLTSAVEDCPPIISEMTETVSAVSAGDGRLENLSDRFDDVSKTLSDLRAELTRLVSDSKDTHTTSNPIETSVETTSAPTSGKTVD